MLLRLFQHRSAPEPRAVAPGGTIEISGATDFLCMAKKLGARRTLSKPFRGDQLLGAVSESLSANSS